MTHQRLFDAERTRLRIRLATGMDDADVISEIVVDVDGDFSDDDLDTIILETQTGGWWTDRSRKNTNWGAASSSAEVILQMATWAMDGTFWALFGVALDRVLSRRSGGGSHLLPADAQAKARQSIVVKFAEHDVSLAVTGESEDNHEGTRTYYYAGALGDYAVTLRTTPKGYPYVSSISWKTRTEHQID